MLVRGTKHLLDIVKRNGGATFDPHSFTTKESGYSVSIEDKYKLSENDTYQLLCNATVEDYQRLDEIIDEAVELGHMLGFWVNKGRLYIDWIDVLDNKQKAIRIGKENNQLAIYDLNNKKEIFLK